MSLHPYRDEELNHFKCLSLVLNEFPKALRQTFKAMWDTTIGRRPGYQLWDDSTAVRNLFVSIEGGTTKVPTHQSYNEWDCTAFFQATIFAKSFSIHSKTLNDLYVKPRAVPYGRFHGSVLSPVGDNAETFALAIDQLRRLRNAVCHSSRLEMDKATFDQNIQYAEEAFKALGIPTASIDVIGSLTASDFPTTEVRKLEQQVREEKQAYIKCLESRNADMKKIEESLASIKKESLTANKEVAEGLRMQQEDISALGKEIHELKKKEEERYKEAEKTDIKSTVPGSVLPSMIPNFTGRQSECQEIVNFVSSEHTRIVTIWGSPGFGKTSVAIAVGHQLQSLRFPVCFLSLRGLQTKAHLTSKLFSLVRQAIPSQRSESQPLSFEDELIETLSSISDSCVFILDNVDDLLESGFPNVKEDVLQLLEEILTRNKKITLVVTTRESFEFINLNFQGHKSIRIRSLDDTSSRTLVHELVPNATPDDCTQIAQICGCVPLAMRLMCSLVSEDDVQPSQCLIEFTESTTESIVDILDYTDYPANQRLQFLYEKSFHRLSPEQKEAFVSLSVLPGCFTTTLAAAVLNVRKCKAITMLKLLQRKSFLDSDSQPGTFIMHKLLQSFAKETGDQRMEEIVANAKCRFHEHYISRFGKLNDEFLNGHSMDAFIAFYEEKQIFIESLVDGCTDPRIAENVFKVLIKAEMFLDTFFWCSMESDNFDTIYDSALKAANALGNTHYQRRLLASKAFSEITWGAEGSSMQLLKKAYEAQSKSCSVSDEERSKYLCYFGICQLVNGEVESGIQCLQEALSLMRESGEHKILRLVVNQVMAVYYQFLNDPSTSTHYYDKAHKECNSAADEQLIVIPPLGRKGKKPKNGKELQTNTFDSENYWPLQFLVIFHIWKAAKNFFDTDTQQFVINPALRMLNDLQINSQTSFYLFHFCGNVMVLLESIFPEEGIVGSGFEESVARHHATIEQFKHSSSGPEEKVDSTVTRRSQECNHPLAKLYQDFGELHHHKKNYSKALYFKTCALDILLRTNKQKANAFLAHSYHSLGVTQHSLGDFTSALQSDQRALDVRIKLFGEDHASTADSYHSLGVTQHSLGDFTSALQSNQRALDVRIKLFGEDHASTAESYNSLGVSQHSLGNFTSALESKQRALDVRLKLLGEDHASTAESYHSLGVTQHSLGDFTSALQSKQRALDVRIKLLGEDHASTAESYNSLGATQHSLGDFTSAMQSDQRALDVRIKLFGEDHSSTAESYHSLGVTQHSLGDFTSALQSKQRALDVRIKLLGEDHASTAKSYHSLGMTQHSLGDFTSALQSKQRALDVRIKLFGEDHASTAESYHSLGVTQHSLGDFTSALHSFQRALDVRIKLFGKDDASTADSLFLFWLTVTCVCHEWLEFLCC
ncbi:uncharacterized protein [Montipora capricornis]|uniref:uncharacterized protein n=1 Tax=Montipora capricornis TaxID=246305 RepID=UPI0035F19D99